MRRVRDDGVVTGCGFCGQKKRGGTGRGRKSHQLVMKELPYDDKVCPGRAMNTDAISVVHP